MPQPPLWLPLFLFAWCSQGIFVLEDANETYSNADFFLMPNNYSLSAPLFKPRWLEGACQLDIEDHFPLGNLLFIDWKEAEDHGCRYIHQLIEGIEQLSPAVTIFSSAREGGVGDLDSERYGNYFKYRYSGLSLTFVGARASARLRELFLQDSNLTCFVSHDAGDWINSKGSPELISHIAICISLLSIGLVFITIRLVMKIRANTFDFKLLTMVYICAFFFCIFKILDLAVDPFSLYGRGPLWLRQFFFFAAYAFGYSAFALIGISWMKVVTSINLNHSWYKTFALHLNRYSYFTIFYWSVGVIGLVLYRHFSGTPSIVFLAEFIYLTLLPMLVINSIILMISGMRILVVLKGGPLEMSVARQKVFQRITILLLFSAFGFFCLMIVMGLNFVNRANTMVFLWLRELCGIGLLTSILLALNLHPNEGQSTEKSRGAPVQMRARGGP